MDSRSCVFTSALLDRRRGVFRSSIPARSLLAILRFAERAGVHGVATTPTNIPRQQAMNMARMRKLHPASGNGGVGPRYEGRIKVRRARLSPSSSTAALLEGGCPLFANSGTSRVLEDTPLALALSRIRCRSAKAVRFMDLSLTLIEVTCAGVTELPSVKNARHC